MEPSAFETVPAVYLERRRLVGRDGETRDEPAIGHIRSLAAKGTVCVVDFGGLRRNKADLDTLRQAADKGHVWADAGPRFATDAMDLLVAGADRVTLRWSAVADVEELREAAAFAEEDALVLGLEFRGRGVEQAIVAHPRAGGEREALTIAHELGLGLAVLDLDRAGSLEGLDRALAARFQSTGLSRWYGGGLRSRDDARALESMGYRGCIVGTAMSKGVWA